MVSSARGSYLKILGGNHIRLYCFVGLLDALVALVRELKNRILMLGTWDFVDSLWFLA